MGKIVPAAEKSPLADVAKRDGGSEATLYTCTSALARGIGRMPSV